MTRNRGKKPSSLLYYQDGPPESVDIDAWRLSIAGPDGSPLGSLSYEEIRELPRVQQDRRMVCVCNWSIRHTWTGALLRSVLLAGGAAQELWADDTLFLRQRSFGTAEKGQYESTIPLRDAIERDALVCYGIDGQPLSIERGYPVRVMDFALYGYKGVKAATALEITTDYDRGYWEVSKGYPLDGTIRPKRYWMVDLCEHRFVREPGEVVDQ